MLRIGPELDEPRTQSMEVNGRKYKLVARDPHGFVHVTDMTANKNFDSIFTSYSDARKAVELHANTFPKKDKN